MPPPRIFRSTIYLVEEVDTARKQETAARPVVYDAARDSFMEETAPLKEHGFLREGKLKYPQQTQAARERSQAIRSVSAAEFLLFTRDVDPKVLKEAITSRWRLDIPDAVFSIPPDETAVTVPPAILRVRGPHSATHLRLRDPHHLPINEAYTPLRLGPRSAAHPAHLSLRVV